MARPQSEGLDYFPLDVDMDSDDKIEYIEAKYGLVAFGIIVKLMMSIYRQGYYMMWTERQQYVFSKRVNVDINTLSTVVNVCINEGLFCKELYEKYKILTSHGVQTRYLRAVERRRGIRMIREYSLITEDDGIKEGLITYQNLQKTDNADNNADSTVVNADNNLMPNDVCVGNMSAEMPQSKVKESNNNNNACARGEIDQQYQDSIHPFASVDESDTLHALMDQYGEQWVSHAITHAVACKRGEAKFLNIRYISRILQNWMEMGRDSPWDTSPRGSGDPSAPVIPLGEYEERRRKEDKAVKERDAQIEAMMMQELAAARHEKI